MRIKNLRGGQWGPIWKNSTPSSPKRRKTTSSATFCATGAWGLRYIYIFFIIYNLWPLFGVQFFNNKHKKVVTKSCLTWNEICFFFKGILNFFLSNLSLWKYLHKSYVVLCVANKDLNPLIKFKAEWIEMRNWKCVSAGDFVW